MSFNQRLADLVRHSRHMTDDLSPAGCGCETGHSDLGAWIFTCRPCMEAGLRALSLATLRAVHDGQLQLEMDRVLKAAAPPESGS